MSYLFENVVVVIFVDVVKDWRKCVFSLFGILGISNSRFNCNQGLQSYCIS